MSVTGCELVAKFASPGAIGAQCCENCHVSAVVSDDQPITPISEGMRAYALDPDRAEALWARSEVLVGERFG